MYSNLPREILEQVFTHPNISRQDLLQLQLTCKQWSAVAQQTLYKEISLDKRTYDEDKANYRSRITAMLGQLTRTLLLSDSQIRNSVKTIYVDAFFKLEDPMVKFATLAHLCPNVTSLLGEHIPAEFYTALPKLYLNETLQRLEYISPPTGRYNSDITMISSYHKAIAIFRETLKEITVIDGVCRTVATADSIEPDYLQHFPRMEHLHLEEFSRFCLPQARDYISNHCLAMKSISIRMRNPGESTPLLAENDDQPIMIPQTQVQTLSLDLISIHLTPNEMAFIMHTFPSLREFNLQFDPTSGNEGIASIQQDTEAVGLFFSYLSLIPRVDYQQTWFDSSNGLDLLSRLTKSIEIHDLSINGLDTLENATDIAAVSIHLHRRIQRKEAYSACRDTINKTNCYFLCNQLYENDTAASFRKLLGFFNNYTQLKSLSLGDLSVGQKITEVSMDYIIDRFISLEELVYISIEFPQEAYNLNTVTAKHLRYLCLMFCEISEDCFTKLSYQLQHVDQFEFITANNGTSAQDILRIYLPYTAINTLELTIYGWASYSIKAWSDSRCTKLSVAGEDTTSSSSTCQVIIHCKSLNEIRAGSKTFKLQ
ncbi:hypothetical protein MBANPS3_002313 [Mucor bainieri]